MKKREFLSEGQEKLIDFYFESKLTNKNIIDICNKMMQELKDEGYDIEELVRNHAKK